MLEATSTCAVVIYADYGNIERVSISSLLPIPKTLLQQPFHIARCALSGRKTFHLFIYFLLSVTLAEIHNAAKSVL